MSSEQPKEYIITMGRIIKARNMLMADGYHNADILDRVANLLRSRPHPAPDRVWTKEDGCSFRVAKMSAMYDNGYADGERKAREDDITKIQEKLDHSKKNLYGFDAKEAEWINGYEAGLDAAIDILREQQAGDKE